MAQAKDAGDQCGPTYPIKMAHRFFPLAALALATLLSTETRATDVDLTKPQPKAVNRSALTISGPGAERTLDFSLWQSSVLATEVIGELAPGVFCSGAEKMRYSKEIDNWVVGQLSKAFKNVAAKHGYALADTARSVFDEKKNGADFKIGATLMGIDFRLCGSQGSFKGDAYAKVKWEVFSARRQKVVYAPIIESSYSSRDSLPGAEFHTSFMEAIAGNLLWDPKFMDLVRSGGVTADELAPAYTALQIAETQTVQGTVAAKSSELVKAVATVESGVGSGSAFYISRTGQLLTNYHVVSDAKFVRVKLSDGRSLVGEVLRSDKARDVALLQTDPIAFDVLGLRSQPVAAGEEVFALGSPFGATLSGTLTRGVLSSKRVIEGIAFLQSDVAINPGNSGGPLVDGKGQVIGIAQLRSETPGLNLFIPIEDALEKLGLTVKASAGH